MGHGVGQTAGEGGVGWLYKSPNYNYTTSAVKMLLVVNSIQMDCMIELS